MLLHIDKWMRTGKEQNLSFLANFYACGASAPKWEVGKSGQAKSKAREIHKQKGA